MALQNTSELSRRLQGSKQQESPETEVTHQDQISLLPIPATVTVKFMQPFMDLETATNNFRGVLEPSNPNFLGLSHIFKLQDKYDPIIEKKAIRNRAAKFYNNVQKSDLSPKQREALTYIKNAIAVTDNEISLEESRRSVS